LVKFSTGHDVRAGGSGNIGATNVLRTEGRGLATATLFLDIAKGYLAVWLASELTGRSPVWMSAAALAVMAGHAYAAFLQFKGGKAVASFIGAFLFLTPLPMLGAVAVFLITTAFTRFISAGSILAAGTFPLGVWLILHPPIAVLAASLLAAIFIVWRHQSNYHRLRAGTEHRFNL
jgi:glycerol-3-phosphate acyltransferase PlsY